MRFFRNCRSGEGRGRPEGKAARALWFGGHALLGIVVVVVVATVVGGVVMAAWNALMPVVFHLPPLEFWQAVALLVLARVLTGRLHHRGPRRYKGGDERCIVSRGLGQTCDESQGLPPNPDAFATWWWEEGKAAFKAFQARRDGSSSPAGQG